MNIVLFTPVLERASAIARMVSCVAKDLIQAGHRVSVVRSEDESFFAERPSDFGVVPVRWTDEDAVYDLLKDADLVVYQIGDNFPFHRGCLAWLARVRGVVCLHDFYVANLFRDWAQENAPAAREALERWYGPDAPASFFAASERATFIEETRASMPMTEWVCAMASGVITHSEWGVSRVEQGCAGPVKVVPLAYFGQMPQDRNEHGRVPADDLVEVLTIGYVNANKRVDSVIRAIGLSPLLRGRVSYKLVGPIQPRVAYELASLARSVGVRLCIYGEVDTAALHQKLDEADVLCCLRWPSLEAASGSAVEAMIHGKAVIVTDTGFYSGLPDDCVLKVDPFNEISSLIGALERLVADGELRRGLGKSSQDWALATFTVRNYAEQIIDMGTLAVIAMPVVDAGRHFSRLLSSWGAVGDIDINDMLKPLQLFERKNA
ncbi:glycosyltransferase family 4 protein [Dyella acidiphila]|uniref:Glycosyltransferase family 4 protein n=1 Tax=Dyella acidiphila TaxID=2775866 RepID=A0ABR9G564_9GAMM|nr:glycosyltransferase family 4 protein [Dyella acidiphila]MBE1159188.1 glycosyltransferase family 4 protein [Dyella acidiphila]